MHTHSYGPSKLRKSTLRADTEDRGQNDNIPNLIGTNHSRHIHTPSAILMFPHPFCALALIQCLTIGKGSAQQMHDMPLRNVK